jgi:CheY-like chemotaxis protein
MPYPPAFPPPSRLPARSVGSAPVLAPAAGSPVVLVVDDDEGIREVVAMLLSDEGYIVQTASNGQEALSSIHTQRPALVLLDLQMPVMTGWQLVEQLRAFRLDVPVVFMSAGVRARSEAVQYSVAGYLAKPFDLDDLLGVVARFVH